MKLSDLIGTAVAAIAAHKFRSALTLLGVTLGALLLFCSLSGGLGVTNAVNQKLSAGDRLLEIMVSTGVQIDDVTPEVARAAGFTEAMSDERRVRLARASGVGGVRRVEMNLQAGERLNEIQHVKVAWSRMGFTATANLNSIRRWAVVTVRGIPPKQVDFSVLLVAGEPIVTTKEKVQQSGVWVSELFLYQNGIRTNQQIEDFVGTTLQVTSRSPQLEDPSMSPEDIRYKTAVKGLTYQSEPLLIRGVYRFPDEDELRSNPDFVLPMGMSIMMPYEVAVQCYQGLDLGDNATTAFVLADDAEFVDDIEAKIGEMGYQTRSLSEIAMQIRTAVLLITLIITSIAGGALLISAIGITNTMVMNVLERRKDIAVMKAIGARDRDLKRIFLIEGFLMGLIGGIAGLVLGLVFANVCGQWIRGQLETRLNEPLGDDVFAYPLWLIVGTPLVSAAITMLASYVPARRAAKIDPAQTLRGL
ncbi:MAG: ABC transporter permease [Pirellulaceae bacterium]